LVILLIIVIVTIIASIFIGILLISGGGYGQVFAIFIAVSLGCFDVPFFLGALLGRKS